MGRTLDTVARWSRRTAGREPTRCTLCGRNVRTGRNLCGTCRNDRNGVTTEHENAQIKADREAFDRAWCERLRARGELEA